MTPSRLVLAASLVTVTTACDPGTQTLDVQPEDYVKGGAVGKADSSVEAIFVDFEFDAEVHVASQFNIGGQIEDQLLYTIGHLNHDNSVGRLDQLQISEVDVQAAAGGGFDVSYHARLPVAWGKRNAVPSTYELRLPADISFGAQQSFTDKYSHDCVDFGAHDVTPGSMWYYYRPERSGCELDDADVVSILADVSVSDINTTGKYPEYHKIWEDDALRVVAVFGKFDDGATSSTDAGISAYNRFSRSVAQQLAGLDLQTVPASIPSSPGVELPELEYTATMADGKQVVVTAMLVDNVRTAPASFNARYAALSRDADLIVYNGHAGLGANIRALAAKGDWQQGQYAIVFMNGCDTYAYVDSALADAHSDVNPDDPNGTKYLDIVTNAMPSFFHSMPGATMALVRGLMDHDDPKTFEQMFSNIDEAEVVLVSGEQDNEFFPGFDGGGGGDGEDPVEPWTGLSGSGTIAANAEDHYETPRLEPGRYTFEISGTADADLYVRTGAAPTVESWECRPFRAGSNETCVVDLTAPASVHVMVRGWDPSSNYQLSGRRD